MTARQIGRIILLLALLVSIVACGSSAGTAAGTPAPAQTAIQAENVETMSAATEPATQPPAETAAESTDEATAAESTGETTAATDYGRILTVMTHDSFDVSADVVAEFEQANEVNLRFLKGGDSGSMLNTAILAKDNPVADVLYGVDNTFFSRAIQADIFEPYKPPTLAQIPADLQLDPEGRLTPVDVGFVTFNYDKAAVGPDKLPAPETLRDLAKPEYKGKIVVESPATSSPGLAFLISTVATFGETGDYPWTKYWEELRANEVEVVDSWETAYYTNFSGSSGKGPQPFVVSYATSPAAEVFFSGGTLAEPPTANFAPERGAFRQIEFVGILQGTKNRELAQRWVDFMTGPRFQADIPLKMFVYPANSEAALPELFQQFAPVPPKPATLPPEEIASKRDQWIREWTRIMQR